MGLTPQSLRATVVTHTHAKSRSKSLGSNVEWKQIDRRTDGGDCITSRANAVGNNDFYMEEHIFPYICQYN